MVITPAVNLPKIYVEPVSEEQEISAPVERINPPALSIDERKRCFAEVEMAFSVEQAVFEARRCLRCDLEFTRPDENQQESATAGENKA